jgi:hypothetical protein
MKPKKIGGKATLAGKRGMKDLPAKRSAEVRGGRDAASGLPTGKRQYKPIGLT